MVEVDPIDFRSWIRWHNKVFPSLDHGPEPIQVVDLENYLTKTAAADVAVNKYNSIVNP